MIYFSKMYHQETIKEIEQREQSEQLEQSEQSKQSPPSLDFALGVCGHYFLADSYCTYTGCDGGGCVSSGQIEEMIREGRADSSSEPQVHYETELPVGGLATGGGAVVEDMTECLDSVVESKYDLSMLPQSERDSHGHLMWDISRRCVVCNASEHAGAVTSNRRLFRKFNCNFIRACPEHYDAVSAHFEKPEFNEPIDNPRGLYETRRCTQCGKNFSAISDSSNSYCNKGCQGNWLDSRFG